MGALNRGIGKRAKKRAAELPSCLLTGRQQLSTLRVPLQFFSRVTSFSEPVKLVSC